VAISNSAIVSWGKYQGDDDGGNAEIIATPGDVIRWGQKGPSRRQTMSYWGIVQEDGSVENVLWHRHTKHGFRNMSIYLKSHPLQQYLYLNCWLSSAQISFFLSWSVGGSNHENLPNLQSSFQP